MNGGHLWWQHGVFYQIYPRSFMDSNEDGIGDLAGIIARLDYLVELGIDAVWISPIFPSPMADFGYDISDYTGVHPMFGDMATFDRLLQEAHARGIRVVLDYVPNHTSDQHPWFVASRSSRDDAKRDWYIWKDPHEDGGPPNNWQSFFGGDAWEWDAATGQYYLHLFLKEQPDLNWRNAEVVGAMHDVLRFWLDKGVDGFRMDAVIGCMKHPDFPDNPPAREGSFFAAMGFAQEPLYVWDRPEVHDVIRRFRQVLEEYGGNRVMIGETAIFDPASLVRYYGASLDEFHIPFNFITLTQPWDAQALTSAIQAYYAAMPPGAAPNFVFGNHDFPRLATRFGWENHRSAGMLLLTLWGVPTLYYGDEIGMRDVPIPADRVRDPAVLRTGGAEGASRDPQRTPMQWDASPNAGFAPAGVDPWLPVADDYQAVNVAVQEADPTSTLSFYKRLLRLRRELPALRRGDCAFVPTTFRDVVAYTRGADGQRLLVVVNFGAEEHTLDLSTAGGGGELLLSTHPFDPGRVDLAALPVRAHESLLVSVA
jgi:alpha-glucosidase